MPAITATVKVSAATKSVKPMPACVGISRFIPASRLIEETKELGIGCRRGRRRNVRSILTQIIALWRKSPDALAGSNVILQRLSFAHSFGYARLDHVANGNDADNIIVFHHRHVPESATRHGFHD